MAGMYASPPVPRVGDKVARGRQLRDLVKATTPSDRELLVEALEDYDHAVDFDRENRDEAADDLRFLAGEQWDFDIQRQREEDGRPCLTLDRTNQAVRQVTGDIRQNSPSIKVLPVDDQTDPKLAEIYTGLIRHIEQRSDAQGSYVIAAEDSARCGIGWLRVMTEYCDDESLDQDARIGFIPNPLSVVADPDAVEPTRKDAKFLYVVSRMTKKAFKSKFPNADLSGFPGDNPEQNYTGIHAWIDRDSVQVAEYWKKVPVTKTLVLFEDGSVVSEETLQTLDPMMRLGRRIVGRRKVETHKVCMWIIGAYQILAGPYEWSTKDIPIVAVMGEEIRVGDRVVRRGVVRPAKDAQRLYNYHRSAGAEMLALMPRAPYILSPEEIEGHEEMWQTANTKNWPYLLANKQPGDPGGSRPQRNSAQLPIQAYSQETMLAAEDIKAATGIYDASLGARSNETSGRAIMARQREGDVATFLYVDNLRRAISHVGKILVDLIPKIYDGQRVVRILEEDGTSFRLMTVNRQVMLPDGRIVVENDITVGKYDVVVTTGPGYTTRRLEAADSMMQFVQAVPNAAAAIMDLVAKNMDWPGADQIAGRLKKLLPPGIAEPEMGPDGQPLPQPMPEAPPPDPLQQAEAALKMAQARAAELDVMLKTIEIQKVAGGGPEGQPVNDIEAAKAAAQLEVQREIQAMKIAADERVEQAKLALEREQFEHTKRMDLLKLQADVRQRAAQAKQTQQVEAKEAEEKRAAEAKPVEPAKPAEPAAPPQPTVIVVPTPSGGKKTIKMERGEDGKISGATVEESEQ